MVKWKQAIGAVAVSIAILAASVQVSSAAPATETRGEPGGTRPCVSQTEYYAVYRGMKRARVFRVFDSRGVVLERRPRFEKRRWWICDAGTSPVRVKFRLRHGTWRLRHKYAAAG
jgi:hypothetical protein